MESSNKTKLALKKNIGNYGQFAEINEMVYCKYSAEWKGPAKVLGRDGPVLFLHQDTKYKKARVCRVQPIKSTSIQYIIPENSQNNSNNTHNIDNQDKTTAPFETNENNSKSKSTTSIQNIEKQTNVSNNPTNLIIKPNQIITFTDENNIDCEAEITSRVGKLTGKYSNCYNIKYHSPSNANGTQTWIGLNKVKNLLIILERVVSSSSNNNQIK